MGRLTTHVLDIAAGRPAAGLRITLTSLDGGAVLGRFVTNADGRLDAPALEGEAFAAGRYELLFAVGDYFRARGVTGDGIAFLEEVPIRFGIADPAQHYHVPLLVSPWAFSTYRGS
ncbi:hydroxyisourate hydrolase [Azospirillum thermophilum]|uniref:5-hydroxyisourate hydrolase n=1 Tax=Azospirillum thermophilum TaxID=2202148 RepID=A0A2S2CVY0_9PROT|nr:hydroxyisourate hydrolase [Azospirillum thermophilum]AWK88437.1 hydroxyisourate hydrolase [Azospirillum thermophilum]